jgi:hypothetical protein
VARFASFLGQPPIRATLTWTVPDRRITITGKRGNDPFPREIQRLVFVATHAERRCRDGSVGRSLGLDRELERLARMSRSL